MKYSNCSYLILAASLLISQNAECSHRFSLSNVKQYLFGKTKGKSKATEQVTKYTNGDKCKQDLYNIFKCVHDIIGVESLIDVEHRQKGESQYESGVKTRIIGEFKGLVDRTNGVNLRVFDSFVVEANRLLGKKVKSLHVKDMLQALRTAYDRALTEIVTISSNNKQYVTYDELCKANNVSQNNDMNLNVKGQYAFTEAVIRELKKISFEISVVLGQTSLSDDIINGVKDACLQKIKTISERIIERSSLKELSQYTNDMSLDEIKVAIDGDIRAILVGLDFYAAGLKAIDKSRKRRSIDLTSSLAKEKRRRNTVDNGSMQRQRKVNEENGFQQLSDQSNGEADSSSPSKEKPRRNTVDNGSMQRQRKVNEEKEFQQLSGQNKGEANSSLLQPPHQPLLDQNVAQDEQLSGQNKGEANSSLLSPSHQPLLDQNVAQDEQLSGQNKGEVYSSSPLPPHQPLLEQNASQDEQLSDQSNVEADSSLLPPPPPPLSVQNVSQDKQPNISLKSVASPSGSTVNSGGLLGDIRKGVILKSAKGEGIDSVSDDFKQKFDEAVSNWDEDALQGMLSENRKSVMALLGEMKADSLGNVPDSVFKSIGDTLKRDELSSLAKSGKVDFIAALNLKSEKAKRLYNNIAKEAGNPLTSSLMLQVGIAERNFNGGGVQEQDEEEGEEDEDWED